MKVWSGGGFTEIFFFCKNNCSGDKTSKVGSPDYGPWVLSLMRSLFFVRVGKIGWARD